MRFNKIFLSGLVVSSLLLSGCSTTDEVGAGLNDGARTVAADQSVNTQGYNSDGGLSESELSAEALGAEFSDPQNPLSKRTIYFQYDSSLVQQDFIPVIAAHAQYLLSHPKYRLILEGHADERGSREYNIALGEQRAKSVARMMEVQGVPATQLEVISYGEEKPAVEGHNEAAWQLNRRVELIYQGQ